MNINSDAPMFDRRQLVRDLLSKRTDTLIITGLGSSNYDVAAAGDCDENFYLWGAMGLAISVGLGLAISQPQRRVVVVTGDGETMMGIGSLATVAAHGPENFAILVLDNEMFAETGNQPGLTRGCADIEKMAQGAGFTSTLTATSEDHLTLAKELLYVTKGPCLVVAKIAMSEDERVLPSRNGSYNAERFRQSLGIRT